MFKGGCVFHLKELKVITILLIWFSCLQSANALPYRPINDNEVIDILPAGSATYQTRLQFQNKRIPPFSVVEPQITALLQQSYISGDPRSLGQAESLLEPYNRLNTPQVLLIRANIAQAGHQFDQAQKDLKVLLEQLPNQPDALLMLSSIQLVQGKFTEAKQVCNQLNDVGVLILKIACIAQIEGMTGKLQESATKLQQLIQLNNGLTNEQQRWLNLILADMALRLDDPVLAKQIFENMDRESGPALTARADWLMAHQDWPRVKELLKNHTDNDSLLLRLVMSELHMKSAQASQHLKLLEERMNIWRERGETAHQREQAQYALLLTDPHIALNMARLNWQQQRETADIVVYAYAAIRSKSKADISIISNWIKQNGFEYPALTQLIAQAGQTS